MIMTDITFKNGYKAKYYGNLKEIMRNYQNINWEDVTDISVRERTLLEKYEMALEKAKNDSKLQCHVGQIKAKIEDLKDKDYEVTVLDNVWIDYFLS